MDLAGVWRCGFGAKATERPADETSRAANRDVKNNLPIGGVSGKPTEPFQSNWTRVSRESIEAGAHSSDNWWWICPETSGFCQRRFIRIAAPGGQSRVDRPDACFLRIVRHRLVAGYSASSKKSPSPAR